MIYRVLLVLVCLGALALAYYYGLNEQISLFALKARHLELQTYYADKPLVVIVAFVLGYVGFTALTLPGQTILTLAGGAIFGSWLGTLLVSLSATIGATIAFWLARYVFRDFVQRRFAERIQTVNAAMAKDGPSYLFSARLLPIVPFPVLNGVMALTQISTWQYFYISFLAMLPGIAIFVIAGTRLAEIESLMDILSPEMFLLFIALGLLPWLGKAYHAALRYI